MTWETLTVTKKPVRGVFSLDSTATLRYREENGTRHWEQKVVQEIYFYGDTLSGVVDLLHSKAEGLVDVTIATEIEYGSYGDPDRQIVNMTGWSRNVKRGFIAAGEAELLDIAGRAEEAEKSRRDNARAQMAALLDAYPDLLEGE